MIKTKRGNRNVRHKITRRDTAWVEVKNEYGDPVLTSGSNEKPNFFLAIYTVIDDFTHVIYVQLLY